MFKKSQSTPLVHVQASDHEQLRQESFLKEHFPEKNYEYVVYAFVFSARRSGVQVFVPVIGEEHIAIQVEDGDVVRPCRVRHGDGESLDCPSWMQHIELELKREDVHEAASTSPTRGFISSPTGSSAFLHLYLPAAAWQTALDLFSVARLTPQELLLSLGTRRQLPHAPTEFREEIVTYRLSLLPDET